MREKIIWCVLFIAVLISCNTKIDVQNEESYRIDLEKELKNKNQKLSNIFENAKLILLDIESNAFFGDISSLKMFADTLYIFDRGQTKFIYKYTKNGKFIGRIGKLGKGPGEYLTPTDFDVNPTNGEVSIHCWSAKKIITYNCNGEFMRSFDCSGRFTSFAIFENLFYCAKSYSKEKQDDLFYCHNRKGDVLYSNFSSSAYQKINSHFFRFGSPIYKYDEDIKFVISCCDTVFSINSSTINPFLTFALSEKIKSKLDDEGLQLHAYSQNKNTAFLNLVIGNIPYHFFYFFNSERSILYNYLEDFEDITNLPVTLLGIYGTTAIGTVSASNIPFMTSLINSGKINNPEVKEFIKSQGNNILLILYEFKDENNIAL
jgi:hypothetical protein